MRIGIFLFGIASLLIFGSLVAAADTSLLVNATLDGPIANDGDIFDINFAVKNIGSVTATNVLGKLNNIPPGWTLEHSTMVNFGNIAPNQIKKTTYRIERDEEDATIYFTADGDNTDPADSRRVAIPIHPLVLVAISAIIIGTYLFVRKK